MSDPLTLHAQDVRRFLPLDVVQPNFSHTALGNLAKCPRKFLFAERCRLTSANLAEPLVIGQLVHLELAARFRGFTDAQCAEVMASAQRQLEEFLLERGDPAALSQHTEVPQWVAIARCTADHFWRNNPFTARRGYEVIATEKTYTMEHESLGVPIKGVVDLLMRSPDGKVYVLDFKTTGDNPTYWIEKYPVGWQTRIYGWLTSRDEALTPKPSGMIYAVVRKPTIKWKAWQEFGDYLAECRDWYEGKEGVCPSNPSKTWDHRKNTLKAEKMIDYHPDPFREGAFSLSADPEGAEVLQTFMAARQASPWLPFYPRTGEAAGVCNSRSFGKCEFLGLCRNPPELWEGEARKLIRREDTPSLGDPEDHLWQDYLKSGELSDRTTV